jgi:hypothetical protein
MIVTVIPTTVVLDNGLAWTECEVPTHEYGLGPDEEILVRCAPKPIWAAADQQRMGQKKDSLYPTFSDLQITIGTDRYETRLMNWDKEGCCRYQLIKNGAVISEIKTVFGAVDPNINFWNIAGKFVWEIASFPRSLLIVDGVNSAEKYQLEGAYFPYEIQGKMIYIAQKSGKYQVMYAEKPIGPEFDKISMPYCCGLTKLRYGSGQYWFVGSHAGRMVLVSIH